MKMILQNLKYKKEGRVVCEGLWVEIVWFLSQEKGEKKNSAIKS